MIMETIMHLDVIQQQVKVSGWGQSSVSPQKWEGAGRKRDNNSAEV